MHGIFMNASRPYFQYGIAKLEQLVAQNSMNTSKLRAILRELDHRDTDRATRLRKTINDLLTAQAGSAPAAGPLFTRTPRKRNAEAESWIDPMQTRKPSSSSMQSPTPAPFEMSQSSTETIREIDPQTRHWTYDAIAKLRAKLIDLSRRSPLIAFKHSSRSASQLRVIDERPDLLFTQINKGSMGFEPLPGEEQAPADERTPQFGIAYEHARLTNGDFISATEKLGDTDNDARAWQDAERKLRSSVRAQLGLPELDYGKALDVAALARAHGFVPSYDLGLSDDEDVQAHHEDANIRVLMTRKELERRLKSINDRANSHLRETGHHTLHLAIGFVQWFEDDVSDLPFHAPLLLLPVKLTKDDGRAKKDFRLAVREGGLEVNVALAEKARADWGLQLPELREEETPESYFIRAKAVLELGRRLKLRHYITLAVFPPMILWRDLDPEKWAQDAFTSHRLLPGMVGACEIKGVPNDDTIIDIDAPENEPRVPALITDADASQHRAIMDMAAGRDMAIEGPPGTGKSQTITNMIATALAQGKRVLFVAEKQAALRVVSDRLRAAGFGPLLLELHGDKASRADVYAGVRERLAAQPRASAGELEEKRAELRRHRDTLRRYLALLRTPIGSLGKSVHELIWRQVRLRNRFNAVQIKIAEERWSPGNASLLDRATLKENRERLSQFGRALLALDEGDSSSRTHWAMAKRLNAFDQRAALDAAAAAGAAATAVAEAVDRLKQQGIVLPAPASNLIADAALQLAGLSAFSCDEEPIVNAALHSPAACSELLDAQATWQSMLMVIGSAFDDPQSVGRSDAEALKEALQIKSCPATLADIEIEKAGLERLRAALSSASRDVERFATRMLGGERTTASKAQAVAKAMSDLANTEPSSTTLMTTSLVDPVADRAIAISTDAASALITERNTLRGCVTSEAFSADPANLDELALTLETANAIARIFSSRFKAAKQRASALCPDTSDRVQLASNLRRTSSFLRAKQDFQNDSKASGLFPTLLWDGISSDFEALKRARTLISAASAKLARMDELEVFQWWISADAVERQSFGTASERLSNMLEEAIANGFSEVALFELESTLSQRIAELETVICRGKTANLRPDALLQSASGGTVADNLLQLHRAGENFERLKKAPCFAWVGDVSVPLESLSCTLREIEHIESMAGPVDVLTSIRQADRPAPFISSIVVNVEALTPAAGEWLRTIKHLSEAHDIEIDALFGEASWSDAAALLTRMSLDSQGASLAADLLKYRAAVIERDLDAFADAAAAGNVPADRLDDIYELQAVSSLLQQFLGSNGEELGRLGSLTLDAARQSFKRIDKQLHRLEAATIVAQRLQDRAPDGVGFGRKSDYTEMRLLENEINLVRPRTPLRDVTRRAGQALQALKPVWMMSPTSVAQYIGRGSLSFDLLIIDEASQMRPEFSVSCVLRADQLVVVGDTNQLPPSDHFQVARGDSLDEDGDVGVDDSTESILDLANQRFPTKPRLKWHYRSQHESLIQFSNRQFYERDLIIFPSPMANDDPLLGVKCLYAPAYHHDTSYEASINHREAELVIEEAFRLMQTYPERSIGIVAMNAKQTELIENEFARLRVEDDRVAKYIEAFEGTLDEFFIKNLENVQGDERDIIIISTVYGPDKGGVVRQNFGLMNREVGWRRLNVLVTRAKLSCRLVTSLRPDDIKVTDKSSKGVLAFKSYLSYAHGGAQYDDASGGEADSEFEIFVADALRAAGYDVVYQVGVEKFRIDLGVRHSSCPVGFIAGIECDGATYHTGLSVRDRDHIRQTILENLGWNIYRVWSTDWFSDPARETAKLLAWLDRVKEKLENKLVTTLPAEEADQADTGSALSLPVSEPARQYLDTEDHSKVVNQQLVREPKGRQLRSLGDFETYEAVQGKIYEVWKDDEFLGEVEIVKRSLGAPKLFGDRVSTERSEYEGRVARNDDYFTSYDIYAAIREVARRALADDSDD
ncbi:MAG: DUF4011 domain-containing protein [Erythrobacteraceae bacterium]|nr:DUF4011 domain-containing protein [Erythrobacteraceae bacterium]